MRYLALLLVLASCNNAEPPAPPASPAPPAPEVSPAPPASPASSMCKGTKLAIPQRGISYGLSRAEATLIMREAYPTAALELENGKLSVVFYDPPHETFAFFDLFFEKDSLVGLDFAYTPAFISQLGGYDSAVVAIYKKAMEKYGEAAKLDKTEKTLKTSWAVQNGGDLTLYAGRPQTVLMSYSCVELKNALSEK